MQWNICEMGKASQTAMCWVAVSTTTVTMSLTVSVAFFYLLFLVFISSFQIMMLRVENWMKKNSLIRMHIPKNYTFRKVGAMMFSPFIYWFLCIMWDLCKNSKYMYYSGKTFEEENSNVKVIRKSESIEYFSVFNCWMIVGTTFLVYISVHLA